MTKRSVPVPSLVYDAPPDAPLSYKAAFSPHDYNGPDASSPSRDWQLPRAEERAYVTMRSVRWFPVDSIACSGADAWCRDRGRGDGGAMDESYKTKVGSVSQAACMSLLSC